MALLSERLREANSATWDAMQAHRFVRDIEADALPAEVFGRYLVYECRFVETAILIFGHALLQAPDLAARRWLCAVLNGLAGDQLSYFDRVFASLGIAPSPAARVPEAVTAFDRGMRRAAEMGGYVDVLTIMLAAEWMYASWCARASRAAISDPAVAEWVRLHAEPGFQAQAEWLRRQVDAAKVDNAGFAHLCELFGRTLELEIAFHHAPYETVPA